MQRTVLILLAAVATTLAACRISGPRGLGFGQHHYPFEREVELFPTADALQRLNVEDAAGDVKIHGRADRARVVAIVHERSQGIGQLSIEGGTLRVTGPARDAILGDVEIWHTGPVDELLIHTSVGDIDVIDMDVLDRVDLSSGVGDIRVRRLFTSDRTFISTSTGDVAVDELETEILVISTGVGDIRLAQVRAEKANVTSGVGDVDVSHSILRSLDAETGVGDLSVTDSDVEHGSYDSGVGTISAG